MRPEIKTAKPRRPSALSSPRLALSWPRRPSRAPFGGSEQGPPPTPLLALEDKASSGSPHSDPVYSTMYWVRCLTPDAREETRGQSPVFPASHS